MKKQESIYFHRIKHNILGGFSMGLFGKSKKEIEREEIEKDFQGKYGISREEASRNGSCMGRSLGTLDLDAIIKLRSPGFHATIKDIYWDTQSNKKEITMLNEKYDQIINAINKQNELLSLLLSKADNKNSSLRIAR